MNLKLQKMSSADLDAYLETAIPTYAKEKMKGEGMSESDAKALAEKSYADLLPKGINSDNQFLFNIVEEGSSQKAGILWFAIRVNGDHKYAFVYDIELEQDHRGKGYGKRSMELLEKEVESKGLDSIGLHVFGHNKVAIGLYEKMGYRATNIMMRKDLD